MLVVKEILRYCDELPPVSDPFIYKSSGVSVYSTPVRSVAMLEFGQIDVEEQLHFL